MWTKHELEDLSETFRDIKLEDIVDEEELAVIKENSTRYFNLKNGVVVPKHKQSVSFWPVLLPLQRFQTKTILLKQIDGAIYMDSWLKAIGECLRWGPMNIWVGFSFLMESHQGGERKIVYW